METGEQEILAKVRTLLALERNCLAEERTVLAELRTGLMLALIGPPASTVIAYILSLFPIETLLFDLFNIVFFSILTVLGIWMSFRSRFELHKIKRKKTLLNARKVAIAKSSKVVHDLLGDFLDIDERQRMSMRRELIFLMDPRRWSSANAYSIKLKSLFTRLAGILRRIFRVRKEQR